MKKAKLQRYVKIARISGISCGVFWIVFGIIMRFNNLVNTEIVNFSFTAAFTIIISVLIGYKWEIAAGMLLCLEGYTAVFILIFKNNIIGAIILGMPPLISGILFIIHWNKIRLLKQVRIGPVNY